MKRWTDDVPPITFAELSAHRKRALAEPVYREPIYPPGWTMTECGPLPPGWEVVDGKPVREVLAFVYAWRRARLGPVAWDGFARSVMP